MDTDILKKVIVDPDIMVGKPIIKGTRITVEFIIRLLAEGRSREEILRGYPHLTEEDISAAVSYNKRAGSGDF